jgi:hypothetical protein
MTGDHWRTEIDPNAGLGPNIMSAIFEKTKRYKILKAK